MSSSPFKFAPDSMWPFLWMASCTGASGTKQYAGQVFHEYTPVY